MPENPDVKLHGLSHDTDSFRLQEQTSTPHFNHYGPAQLYHGSMGVFGNNYGIINMQADHAHLLKQRLLESLRFPEMNARLNGIRDSEFHTFEWVFDDRAKAGQELPTLKSWLRESQGIYLVEGKAGSGKSTFMKFLFEHDKTLDLIREWSGGRPVQLLFHSFWLVGSKLQHNWKGFLASMIFQILSSSEESSPISALPKSAHKRSLNDWSTKELFKTCLQLLRNGRCLYCMFIDGLDEFDPEDDVIRLYDLFDELQAHENIKICLSSRPIQHILDHFKNVQGLRLQDLTRSDILQYVSSTIMKTFIACPSQDLRLDEKVARLSGTICRQADGVFLWAYCVLRNVVSGLRADDDFVALDCRISLLPSELKELYQHMWTRQNNDNIIHAAESKRMFSWLTRAQDHMPLFKLLLLVNDDFRQRRMAAGTRVMNQDTFEKHCVSFKRKLSVRSAGLIECIDLTCAENVLSRQYTTLGSYWWDSHVQFTHRSVHDYLTDTPEGMSISAWPGTLGEDLALTYTQAVTACFVQNADMFTIHGCERFLSQLAKIATVPAEAIEYTDNFCSKLISQRQSALMRDDGGGRNWVFVMMKHAHPFWKFLLDFPGLVLSSTFSVPILGYLLETRGQHWSQYYRAYLVCCILLRCSYPYGEANWGRVNGIIQFLEHGGIDWLTPQVTFQIDLMVIRPPWVQLLAVLLENLREERISVSEALDMCACFPRVMGNSTVKQALTVFKDRYNFHGTHPVSIDTGYYFCITFDAAQLWHALKGFLEWSARYGASKM